MQTILPPPVMGKSQIESREAIQSRFKSNRDFDLPITGPAAKKLSPKFPPQEFCYVTVVHSQNAQKNYEYYYIMKVKKVR